MKNAYHRAYTTTSTSCWAGAGGGRWAGWMAGMQQNVGSAVRPLWALQPPAPNPHPWLRRSTHTHTCQQYLHPAATTPDNVQRTTHTQHSTAGERTSRPSTNCTMAGWLQSYCWLSHASRSATTSLRSRNCGSAEWGGMGWGGVAGQGVGDGWWVRECATGGTVDRRGACRGWQGWLAGWLLAGWCHGQSSRRQVGPCQAHTHTLVQPAPHCPRPPHHHHHRHHHPARHAHTRSAGRPPAHPNHKADQHERFGDAPQHQLGGVHPDLLAGSYVHDQLRRGRQAGGGKGRASREQGAGVSWWVAQAGRQAGRQAGARAGRPSRPAGQAGSRRRRAEQDRLRRRRRLAPLPASFSQCQRRLRSRPQSVQPPATPAGQDHPAGRGRGSGSTRGQR